jgi:protein TonB
VSVAEAFAQTFPAPEWWQRMDTSQRVLALALLVSTLAHGSLLGVRFATPNEFRMQSKDVSLDVILVNAKHASKPAKAEALAQANLDGGGEATKGRSKSFLTNSRQTQDGDQLQEAARRAQQLEADQKKLMSSLKESTNKVAAMSVQPQVQLSATAPVQPTAGLDAAENARIMKTAEAEITKRIEYENARPKRGYITPSTREVEYARYYKNWADTVERWGNNNYPEKARGKTYQLTMTVSVLANGRVEKIEIERSSGVKEIDAAARNIVRRGEPYDRFTQQMLTKYGVLDLTMTWTFSRTDALSVETQR